MRDALAVDKWILLAVIGLVAMGVIMVLSTSYLYSQERYADGTFFFRKQMISMGLGALLLIVCSLLSPAFYRRDAKWCHQGRTTCRKGIAVGCGTKTKRRLIACERF